MKRKLEADGEDEFNLTVSRVPILRPKGKKGDAGEPEDRASFGFIFLDK